MMRTSVLIGVRPPTLVYSPCCSTRKSRVCASIGMSPISSRNSVPPSACSKRPELRVFAPVNAPFSWPKDRKSTRLNSSHGYISYAVFCLKKKIYYILPLGASGQHPVSLDDCLVEVLSHLAARMRHVVNPQALLKLYWGASPSLRPLPVAI